jgi:hypothetical protein
LYPNLTIPAYFVVGAVAVGGRVIEATHGFRAEKALPLALLDADDYLPPMASDLPSADPDVIRALADAYDIPVLPRRELVEYARWNGEMVTPAEVAWALRVPETKVPA